jgi:hypothetical protein
VRRIQDDELFKALSMAGRDPPADSRSPIMAHNRETTSSKMICKAENIERERVEIVSRDFRWLVAQIVAALVRRHDVIARRRKRLEIGFLCLPILWKPVQQADQAAVLRTCLSHMEHHTIYLDARKLNIHHVSSCTRARIAGPGGSRHPAIFRATPPSVHQTVLALERAGFIRRQPGVARSIEVLVDPKLVPELPSSSARNSSPRSAHCSADAPLPATSCLGAF